MATPSPALPLRACLLSGGESRRMGRDKALLPHPHGGTWLEQSVRRLAALELPVSVFSRHPQHLTLTAHLADALAHGQGAGLEAPAPTITALAEPPPWEGPLLALHRLMEEHPQQRLLLCPVDMPALNDAVLRRLLAVAATEPAAIHLAHDGLRLQPLLGIYPSDGPHRSSLRAAIAAGQRRLQAWLATQHSRAVPLEPAALRNSNSPADLPAWDGHGQG